MVNFSQNAGKPADMICLCIGGRLFVTRRATLYRLPDSRLYLIATQGCGGQTNPTPVSNIHMSNSFNSTSDTQPLLNSTASYPINQETTTVGGATIMPSNMAAMLTGNMTLMSASSLCRTRGSMTNTATQYPSTICKGQLNSGDGNVAGNLSTSFLPGTPGTPTPSSVGVTTSFVQPVTAPPIVYFYDRDPEIFRFVLDYYRTGELHLPSSICGPFVRKELIFWGIDESLIGPCCMPAYMRYDEERRTKNTLFRDCFEDIDSMQNLVKFSRGWKKWRYRMWLFMDHPSSSLPAKIWASCLLVLMIASVMCYCLSTHKGFRMESPIIRSTLIQRIRFQNSTNATEASDANITIQEWSHYPRTDHDKFTGISKIAPEAEGEDEPLLEEFTRMCIEEKTNPKVNKDCTTEPTRGLVLFDIVLNLLFTTEFMLKVLLAPDKPKFLSSIVSIIDIIILSSYWVYMCAFYYYYYYPKSLMISPREADDMLSPKLWWMNILSMTQALRILRIFKISKISRGLRVLILTVKKSIPELVLLGFLLMNGMFLFSCLIYMAEYRQEDTFVDIPQSFWWSIITLTAVGYGDMHPKGAAGYFVGSVTAISGCVVTGLAIPIIGNNFNTYYKYMKNQLMEDKYLKTLRKDMDFGGRPCGKSGICAAAEKSGISLPGRKVRQFQRRAARNRNIHIPSRRTIGFQIAFSRLVETIANSFRRLFTLRNRTGPRDQVKTNRNLVTNENSSTARSSMQVLKNEQQTPKGVFRNSMSHRLHFKENESSSAALLPKNVVKKNSNTSILTNMEPTGIDHRPSLLQPMSTDNLLNLRAPCLNCAPQIWVDGDDLLDPLNESMAYNDAIDDELLGTCNRNANFSGTLTTNFSATGVDYSVYHVLEDHGKCKVNKKQLTSNCSGTEVVRIANDVGNLCQKKISSQPSDYPKSQIVQISNQLGAKEITCTIQKRTNYV